MYPVPPQPMGAGPSAPGPAGLEAGVAKLFQAQQSGEPAPLPDPYENIDRVALLKRFKDAKADGQEMRWVFERQWWRDLLYVLGRQWVFFDAKRNEWRDKRLKKWIPKPVTNKVKEVQNAIRSMFASVQLGTISRPNGNDPKNIATANTVDGLQPLIHEEHKMDKRMRLADFWAVNLGSVFLFPWWNPDEGEVKAVTADECQNCGAILDAGAMQNPAAPMCAECGSGDIMPVKTGDAPIGRGQTDIVSPFEVLLPSYAAQFDEVDKFIRVRWRPKAYFETHYPELVGKLSFQKQTGERSLHLFKALAAQNDMSTTPFTFGAGQRSQAEGLTEYEYWEKPTALWPRGLFFRVLGDNSEQILEDPNQSSPGPIPCTTIKGEPLWPWVQYGYEEFGGRLWPGGAISTLIQKQDQLNQLDSHTQLCVQRMGNPIWLEPKGAEVEKFTGEPGLVIKYNLLGTTGLGKPERIPGESVPASNFQLREQYLRDIEEMAGTYDVLKGNKPTGVEAFSALQLLVERSQSRFTTAFGMRGEAYQEWFRIALELERKYGPTQRTMSLLGPNGAWTFQTFEQADLMGDVTIVVEDGTNVPKTALGKRAAMEQAKNMGFVDPLDPDTKHAFLSEQGLYNLMPGLDSAKKAALRQQDAFEQWVGAGLNGPPPLVMRPWDNPLIIMNEMRKWANGDKMQAIINDPNTGEIVLTVLTIFWNGLQMLIAPPPMPGPGGAPEGPPKPGGNPSPAGPPKPGGPPGTAPGHAPGAGQAMARSNANSTDPKIATKGQSIAPVTPGAPG